MISRRSGKGHHEKPRASEGEASSKQQGASNKHHPALRFFAGQGEDYFTHHILPIHFVKLTTDSEQFLRPLLF